MICLQEAIIFRLLVENKKYHQDICGAIGKLKKILGRKDFVVRVTYRTPQPDSPHRNYGKLDVSVDMDRGRGGSMSERSIATAVKKAMEKAGLGKYFKGNGTSYEGNRTEVSYLLNDRYVKQYLGSDKEEPMVEHFDKMSFPEVMGLGDFKKAYTYKGHTIDLVEERDDKYGLGWTAKFDPPVSIAGSQRSDALAKTRDGALSSAKKLIDVSKMSPEIQKAFDFVEYASMGGVNEEYPIANRQWLAREIEAERGELMKEDPDGYEAFQSLPLEMRLKLIDEVVEMFNN